MKIKTLLLLSASALMLVSCNNKKSDDGGSKKEDSTSQKSEEASSSTQADSATSSSDPVDTGSSSSTPDDTSSSVTPTPAEKVNLFYQEGDIQIGVGETAMSAGQMGCWFGDGGTVSAFTHANGKYSLSYAAAGQWYGVQVFYKLPYSVSGDSYHIETTFHSDVAGSFTINSEVITVEANKDYSYSKDFDTTSSTVISMQLGVNGQSLMGGALLTFTDPVIKDNTKNKYNKVTFSDGTNVVKEIQVRDGKTVKAPSDPSAPSGKIFDGWYDGTEKYTPETTISAAKNYVAKFADASSAKTVTFKSPDGTILKTVSVASGSTVSAPSDVSIYAYSITGWKTENGTAFDFSAAISSDLTLIAVTKIAPTTWFDASDTGYVIPEQHLSVTDDNAFKVSGLATYKADAWKVQVNFASMPANETKTYTVSFEYMINGTGGDAQVYSGATYGDVVTLEKSTSFKKASITFAGPIGQGDKKLTFELGKIADVDTIEFQVKNVSLTAK